MRTSVHMTTTGKNKQMALSLILKETLWLLQTMSIIFGIHRFDIQPDKERSLGAPGSVG